MSTTDVSANTEIPPSKPSGGTDLQRRKLIAAVALAVVLVGVIVAVASWRRNPNLIGVNGSGVEPNGVPLSEAAYAINIADPLGGHGTETITLKSAAVHVPTNTAGATVTLAICVSKVGPGGNQIGVVRPQELGEYCSRVTPIRPGTKMVSVGSGSPKEYIILTVRATKPGLVRASHLRITYQRGWNHLYQRGSLDAPIAVAVRVVADKSQ